MVYKQYKTIEGSIADGIIRLPDNAFIPFDLANTDYQEFVQWCEQGNTPEPAEEV